MKVYLCGPINGCTDEECINWRQTASESLVKAGIEILDPTVRDYRNCVLTKKEIHEVIQKDILDIEQSDLILANIPKISVGTSMELWVANQMLHKPTVVVWPYTTSVPIWLHYCSTFLARSLNEGLEEVLTILNLD